MSMDDIFERANALEKELTNFNRQLQASFNQVHNSHNAVSPLWNDTMRRDYDKTWKPIESKMDEYNSRIGPQYVDFITTRLKHLKAYLHGS